MLLEWREKRRAKIIVGMGEKKKEKKKADWTLAGHLPSYATHDNTPALTKFQADFTATEGECTASVGNKHLDQLFISGATISVRLCASLSLFLRRKSVYKLVSAGVILQVLP